MPVDHMESHTHCSQTRCGRDANHIKGSVFDYGSPKTTCKTCLRLHARDLEKENNIHLFKCIRTDCGIGGCESKVHHTEPPEFCLYDFDEAHWVLSDDLANEDIDLRKRGAFRELLRGDDQ